MRRSLHHRGRDEAAGVVSEGAALSDLEGGADSEDDEALSGVTIENLDYKDFLRRYDRPGTLFYLDPPYYGNEGDYGRDLFSREEFSAMAEILKALQGRFILSLNDRPEVRRIFAAFTITPVKTTYSVGQKGRGKERGELLIMNGKRRRAATAD